MELNWFEIIGYAIGICGAVLGVAFWTKWQKGVALLREIGEAFTKTSLALGDKRLTRDEALELLKEWKDCVTLVFDLFGRK